MPLQYAIAGACRAANTRSGYLPTARFVSFTINGVDRTRLTGRYESVIHDQLNDAVNTATLLVRGFTPVVGQTVTITWNPSGVKLFSGLIVQVAQLQSRTADRLRYRLECLDWSYLLNLRLVSQDFGTAAADVTVAALMASFTSGFTTTNLEAGLASIEFSAKMETVAQALTRLANLVGAFWYVDYDKDLHFRISENLTNPAPLDTTNKTYSRLNYRTNIQQVRTRVLVEGGGGVALANVAVGDSIIPIEPLSWYAPNGGVVVDGAQRITYGGITEITPGSAPIAAAAIGAGVAPGIYQYGFTYVTAAGETLPSPLAAVTTGLLAAPASAPSASLVAGTAGVDDGAHRYAASFVTATGETVPSALSAVVTTGTLTMPPPPTMTGNSQGGGGALATNHTYYYVLTDTTASGETTYSGSYMQVFLASPNTAIGITVPVGAYSGTTGRKIYRWDDVANYRLLTTIADNTTTFVTDNTASVAGNAIVPAVGTATTPFNHVSVGGILTGPTGTSSRNLYRTAAGLSQLKLLASIAGNVNTGYSDSTADASLGANAPTVSTALQQQVALSAITTGPATVTTARKIYRTVAGGSQLKLQQTIANNTATVGVQDATADGALGANAPTNDTSGLSVFGLTTTSGVTNAGATSMTVASATTFQAGGGWALIATSGVTIRYTGTGATTLTGIPASGAGSIPTSIPAGTLVQGSPALTGIPASGPGSIVQAITQGDPINLLVTVDDVAAQAALAALIGGDGILEHYIQDRRLSIAGATARGTAELTLGKDADAVATVVSEDVDACSGRSLTLAISGIAATLKIQQVEISWAPGRARPQRAVTATNRFKDFYQYVRDLETAATRVV